MWLYNLGRRLSEVYATGLCMPWMVAAWCQATDLLFDYQPIKLLSRAACSLKLDAPYGHWLMLLINLHLALWHNNLSRMRIKIKGNSHFLSPPYNCCNKLSESDFSPSFTALAVLRNAEVPCFMHAVLLWGCWLNSSKVHKETFHSYSQRQLY